MKRQRSEPVSKSRDGAEAATDQGNDLTRQFYEQHADAYAKATIGVDLGAIWSTFESLLPPQATVADLGCGAGRDLRRFAESNLAPFGLDLSYPLCKIALETAGRPVVCGDLLRLPFRTGEFDGVWAAATILHLAPLHAQEALGEAQRLLKPGGIAVITLKEGSGTELDKHGRRSRLYSEGLARQMLADQHLNVFELIRSTEERHDREIEWLALFARSDFTKQ